MGEGQGHLPGLGVLCLTHGSMGLVQGFPVPKREKAAAVGAEPRSALPRAAMPAQTSWLPLPTKLSSWTRSTTTSLCRSASPWAKSRPT